jgi:hypothetical protein
VREWLAALRPELQAARGEGQWDLKLTAEVAGDRITAQPQLTLRGVGLKGYVRRRPGAAARPRRRRLRRAHRLRSRRRQHPGRGPAAPRARVELTASGHAANVLGDPAAATGALDCTWSLQPDVVTARLGALLGLAGAPLSGAARVELAPAGATATGTLSGAEIAVTLPADAATGKPARTLVQRELKADFDLTASPWPSVDTLDIRRGEFRSSTAQATVAGRVERLSTPAAASADVRFHLDAELARLLADLGPALGLPAWRPRVGRRRGQADRRRGPARADRRRHDRQPPHGAARAGAAEVRAAVSGRRRLRMPPRPRRPSSSTSPSSPSA